MMQATDFWDGDDSSDAAMLNRAAVAQEGDIRTPNLRLMFDVTKFRASA
jgi:hypothetical protein